MTRPTMITVVALTLFAPKARAADVNYFSVYGQSAAADFRSTGPSTCDQGVEMFVSVQGSLNTQTAKSIGHGSGTVDADPNGSGTVVVPFISVVITVFDYCQNAVLLYAEGDAGNYLQQIDANLGFARVRATNVPLINYTNGSTIYADVDLDWTALVHAPRTSLNSVFQDPGVTLAIHSRGKIRDATASGTLRLHGPVGFGDDATNYTSQPSVDGFIEKDATLEVTITRNVAGGSSGASAGQREAVQPSGPALGIEHSTWGRLKALYR